MIEYIMREIDCGLATRHEIVGELVRCKDCRFYRFYDGTFGKGWMCFENNTARHGDDFCSRGERKDDVHDTNVGKMDESTMGQQNEVKE